MLLLVEVNLILEKQGCKKDTFIAYATGCVKRILALLIKIIALYMQALIIQVEVFGLKEMVVKRSAYLKLAIFLVFNK